MSNPFEKSFAELSNVQLLEIVQNAADYDPQAVSAATSILATRDVLPEECQALENLLQAQRHQVIPKAQVDGYKEKASGLFNALAIGEGKPAEERWISYFLVLLFIQYAWTCQNGIRQIIRLFRYSYYHLNFVTVLNLLPLAYMPIFFYLIYKRRKWGWILVFVQTFLLFFSSFWGVYVLIRFWSNSYYRDYGISFPTSDIILTLSSCLFLIFLYKPRIADTFGASKETKNRTLWTSIGLVLLVSVVLYVFS